MCQMCGRASVRHNNLMFWSSDLLRSAAGIIRPSGQVQWIGLDQIDQGPHRVDSSRLTTRRREQTPMRILMHLQVTSALQHGIWRPD